MSGKSFTRRIRDWLPSIVKPKAGSLLQRKASGAETQAAIPATVHDAVPSPGKPLDPATRSHMEQRFGRDFSGVRVHHGAEAAQSARAVGARAYAVGNNIVFGAGEYAPSTASGRRLMAHELAHTIQQRSASGSSTTRISNAGESEADSAADAVMANRPAPAQPQVGGGMQRDPLPDLPKTPDSDALIENASPLTAAAIGSTTLDGFKTGSAELTEAHKTELAKTAHNINVLLRKYTLSTVTVTGHTDTVGTEANNLTLGDARAQAVKKALVDLKVPETIITTESKGEGAPQAVKTGDEVPNASNRRVEVRFHPESLRMRPVTPPITPTPQKTPPPSVPPIDLKYHPKIEPPDPTKLPPDFWKPIPPPIPGTGPKSALDVINEKIVDPIVDSVTKGLPKSVREKVKDAAHEGVKKGLSKGARAAAEAAGVKDPQALDAIEKAVEAGIQEKGKGTGTTQP